jgi:hypothetical protein
LTEDDRWRRTEPPTRGPSAPHDLKFNPLGTGIGVFLAIAIPAVVLGYTRAAGPNGLIIGAGIIVGLVVGLLVGLWVADRDGVIWRGPQL